MVASQTSGFAHLLLYVLMEQGHNRLYIGHVCKMIFPVQGLLKKEFPLVLGHLSGYVLWI